MTALYSGKVGHDVYIEGLFIKLLLKSYFLNFNNLKLIASPITQIT